MRSSCGLISLTTPIFTPTPGLSLPGASVVPPRDGEKGSLPGDRRREAVICRQIARRDQPPRLMGPDGDQEPVPQYRPSHDHVTAVRRPDDTPAKRPGACEPCV